MEKPRYTFYGALKKLTLFLQPACINGIAIAKSIKGHVHGLGMSATMSLSYAQHQGEKALGPL